MTYLSIIIPAHNEANRLPKTLVSIDAYMSRQKYSYEIIVVENDNNFHKMNTIIQNWTLFT